MEIPRGGDGTRVLQQVQWRGLAALAGKDHGLVFGRVLVGAKQNFVKLLADWGWASARDQIGRPGFDLGLDLLFLFNGQQRLLHDLCRGLAKAPFAAASAEVVRGFVQAQ